MKPVFLLGCYGCIFHGTGNSAQHCKNFGISRGKFEPPQPHLSTPLALVDALSQCLCSESPYLSIKLYRIYVCYTNITLHIVSSQHATTYFAHRNAPTTSLPFDILVGIQHLKNKSNVYILFDTLYALQAYVNQTGSRKARVFYVLLISLILI
jgi:hypothetical protein